MLCQRSQDSSKKTQKTINYYSRIRLPGDSSNDQKRVLTPKNAFENQVSGVVIGRSLTKGNVKNNINRLLNHLNK